MAQDKKAVLMRRATYASVTVAFGLISIKFVAYILTGSVALLSSLIDSVLDSLASILNFIAVRHALEPADEEHRFGVTHKEKLKNLLKSQEKYLNHILQGNIDETGAYTGPLAQRPPGIRPADPMAARKQNK